MRAMPAPSLWDRLRSARIVQVLLVYLGASWAVLQIADVLTEALSLPDWVPPVAVLLLLVGLVIILATAWVQSLPTTTAKEEAGEIPTDWQVAPAEALASLKAGQLPHLTWGRAIREAGADVAAAGIAVLPFAVTGGEELDLWREGMVDVLSTNLDGMGGYRTIDARTVMARWNEQVGAAGSADLRASLEVAGATGARYGLVGNLVGSAGGVRVAADVYDLSTGEKVSQSYVEGPADSVLALVGRLTVGLTRELLAANGQQVMQAPRTAGITTESLDALRYYLDGEAAYRRSDFAAAAASFERATDADSTFALAWYRMSNAYGWMENVGSDVAARAGGRVEALADRLPMRERALMLAVQRGVRDGELSAMPELQEAVAKYPDDPEAWFELGEFYRHRGIDAGVATEEDALEVFRRAVVLDPTFGPYYIHLVESLLNAGLQEEARAAYETYQGLAGAEAAPHLALAMALLGGDAEARQAALDGMESYADEVIYRVGAEINWSNIPDADQSLEFFRAAFRATGNPGVLSFTSQLLFARGRIAEALAEAEDPSTAPQALLGLLAAFAHVDIDPPAALEERVPDLDVCPDRADPGGQCLFDLGMVAVIRGDRAAWRRVVDQNRTLGARYIEEGAVGHGREHDALATFLEGLWTLYRDGDVVAARPKLQVGVDTFTGNLSYVARFHLAEAVGRSSPRDAVRILGSMSGLGTAFAQVRLGRLREQIGDADGARRAYARASEFLAAADEGHPYAVEARDALARLGA